MKNQLSIRNISIAILGISIFLINFQNLNAQTAKKNKVRLKASYVKIMDGEVYFDFSASSKVKKQHIKLSKIELTISNVLGDEKVTLGKVITNMKGKSRFVLKNINAIKPDSTNTYNIMVFFKGNDDFKKASKSIRFKNATIKAALVTKDSINYITATLIDASTNVPLADVPLNVQVQRLFKPLKIGGDFTSTDENGTIFVPIEKGIPGVDGKLTIEVVLDDSEEFGTVKALVNAPIGTPIVDESTFDQRTLWSPRNKTPIFLLIFPNLLIFGIWGLIIYLITNLFKITKS
ncbi:MAG: hypothetical protein COC22_04430 [Flavobacteriaceae bacterium]|nr:MAG: hypothetical protein COC22_04430 [Flavobacteriaceae bacterium]